jgi:hypothetical protein
MNYTEWANDYLETANRFNDRIISLKERKKHTDNFIDKLNIDYNVNQFRLRRDECIRTANMLFKMAEKSKEQDV